MEQRTQVIETAVDTPDALIEASYFPEDQLDCNPEHLSGTEVSEPVTLNTSFSQLSRPTSQSSFLPKLNQKTFKFIACFASMITAGWSDASAGTLIPYMEPYFHIDYMIVSLLFVGQCVGMIVAGSFCVKLIDRFGIGKIIALGAFCQVIAFSLNTPPINFPVMICAYILIGFGIALQLSCSNSWVAGEPNVQKNLGRLHGAYGTGALLSPIAGTAFVSAGIKFSLFYLTSLALAIINLLLMILAFRLAKDEEAPNAATSLAPQTDLLAENAMPVELGDLSGLQSLRTTQPQNEMNGVVGSSSANKMSQIIKNKSVWIVGFFLVAYVGAEVSIGGWIVSYVIKERDGGASAGYVASGFWAGITLGRLLLHRVNTLVGEKRIIFFYLLGVALLQITIWAVPSMIENAVAVAFVGFLLGPFYPNALSLTLKLLPRVLHTGAVGFIASLAQTGSAIFPFLTGVLAQKYGVTVLQPVVLSLCGLMTGFWTLMPRVSRKET